jgi:hypothetical protein
VEALFTQALLEHSGRTESAQAPVAEQSTQARKEVPGG